MTTAHPPQAAVGISTRADIRKAVAEAVNRAGGGADAVLCIAYAGVGHDQNELLNQLKIALPGVPIVGGSSQGACVSGTSIEAERFLAVAVLSGDVKVRIAHVADMRSDERKLGQALAANLGPPPQGAHTTLLWYDPLCGRNVKDLLVGLSDGGYDAVYGGATGQPWDRMVATFQYADGQVYGQGAVVVVLEGLTPVAELTHGAEAIGVALTVTKADGNTVLEIDDRPALDVWCEQLGVLPERNVEMTSNWALGIVPPTGTTYEGFFTRAPFAFDLERRALVLQAPIPCGSRVQVCIRTQSAVFGGAEAMGHRLQAALVGKQAVLALGFECGARPAPFLGGELAEREMRQLEAKLPPALPLIGMYAGGEIAPAGDVSEFHNFTFPMCVLCQP